MGVQEVGPPWAIQKVPRPQYPAALMFHEKLKVPGKNAEWWDGWCITELKEGRPFSNVGQRFLGSGLE